jgi:hypothetical protein
MSVRRMESLFPEHQERSQLMGSMSGEESLSLETLSFLILLKDVKDM